jgi:ubiquinone/menaquinone biosynthesis C-methylase UbiE
VVSVDISEKMIEWSRQRAKEEGVEDKLEFHIADVLSLPFKEDRFDVVFCESVLIFVEDKGRAIRECVRVTKPSGYVGINESFWTKQPSPKMVEQVADAIGPSIPTLEVWRHLWEESGLQERVVRTYTVDARAEVKSRLRWIGWRWLLGAWGRALRLYITNSTVRQSIKKTFNVEPDLFQSIGYGLFVGRK